MGVNVHSMRPPAQDGSDPEEVSGAAVVLIQLGLGEFRQGREEGWVVERTAGEPLRK